MRQAWIVAAVVALAAVVWTCGATSGKHSGSARRAHERVSGRVVGGVAAPVGAFPAQIGLTDGSAANFVYCGGTLIHPQWVLTAAHCVYPEKDRPSDVFVVTGFSSRSAVPNSLLHAAAQFKIHPLYNDATALKDDIALIKLAAPVNMSRPDVALARISASPPATYANVTITGWGATTQAGTGEPVDLQMVTTSIEANSACAANYASEGIAIPDSLLCAGAQCRAPADSCYGDSGGPLWVAAADGGLVQVALTSFGGDPPQQPCAHPTLWAVNTRLTSFLDWISDNMDGDAFLTATPAFEDNPAPCGNDTLPMPTAPAGGAISGRVLLFVGIGVFVLALVVVAAILVVVKTRE